VTRAGVRGVMFDLDGTLYSLRLMKLWMALALWRSVPLLRRLNASRDAIRGTVFPDRGALLAALHRELAARAGTAVERAATWYDREFMPAFVALLARRAVVRPGLAPLLARLRRRGVRTAVVSDFGRVGERVEALGLDAALFDDLVAAEDHGVLKPSPLPFAAVARRWALDAAEIVVVGDREDLDAASARAAGMGFVGVGSWQDASSAIEARTELGVTT
jgi:HAD superfamily hydrolase (TIGR01509 family)